MRSIHFEMTWRRDSSRFSRPRDQTWLIWVFAIESLKVILFFSWIVKVNSALIAFFLWMTLEKKSLIYMIDPFRGGRVVLLLKLWFTNEMQNKIEIIFARVRSAAFCPVNCVYHFRFTSPPIHSKTLTLVELLRRIL